MNKIYKLKNSVSQIGFYCLSLLFLFGGCSIKRQWYQQIDQIDYLQRRVARLDSLQHRQDEFLLELKADIGYRLEQISDKIEYLDAKIEDSQSRLVRIAQKLGLRTAAAEAQPVDTTLPKPPTGADPEVLYNTAYLDFTRGNYDLAIQGFSEYLKLYPDSDLSDNAQYWIGESYFTKQEWQMAFIEFEKVERNYPTGNKLPGALYKMGLCYLNMKNRTEGKKYLDRVIKQFPNSPEAGLAKEQLDNLR
jgi:tol-pal system protein YbgF